MAPRALLVLGLLACLGVANGLKCYTYDGDKTPDLTDEMSADCDGDKCFRVWFEFDDGEGDDGEGVVAGCNESENGCKDGKDEAKKNDDIKGYKCKECDKVQLPYRVGRLRFEACVLVACPFECDVPACFVVCGAHGAKRAVTRPVTQSVSRARTRCSTVERARRAAHTQPHRCTRVLVAPQDNCNHAGTTTFSVTVVLVAAAIAHFQ